MTQSDDRVSVTAEEILELAKKAVFLYEKQDPAEQRRLLQTVLSNCTFDRGSVCPTYTSPFDLFAKGNETENWRREWESWRAISRTLMNAMVSRSSRATTAI